LQKKQERKKKENRKKI